MAAVEMNTSGPEKEQKEEILSPSQEESSEIMNGKSASLNFSELTPRRFGISVQSFTPASLPTCKDKSRLAQIKARRRSSIGVRGSPETNSLIRFMAQQKMKTLPALKTPDLVKSSPFLPRVASTLRQKMASFQNLMDVAESEGCDPMPTQDSNTGGCIKTRDYLSDGNSSDGEKENNPPTVTPSKRRRLGPLESCELEIREASAPTLHFSLKERQEEEIAETQVVTEGPLSDGGTVEEADACFPPMNRQHAVFELQSPRHPPPDDPTAASPAWPASSLHIPSLPPLLEMKPTGEGNSWGTSTIKNKKKVHFGGPLSPEFFDKNLPPSTPLQKGATPARAQTPGGALQLRSLLKTPQGSESQTQKAQSDFSSPTTFGASPTLAIPRNRRTPTVGEDGEDKDGKVEVDSAVMADTDCSWDVQPLNLNNAFHEESLPQVLPASDPEPSAASWLDYLDEFTSLPEKEKQQDAVVAVVESKSRKRKQLGPKCESPARSGSRKRKQPEEGEPVKRSTRSAAKSASGKMKVSSASGRRWNKDVDRSLYGSRAYASKDPNLSPITESLSSISKSPAAQQTPTTAPNDETNINAEVADDSQAIGDLTVTTTSETPSEESFTSSDSGKVSATCRGRRLSGTRGKGRGKKMKNVSAADEILLTEETQSQTGRKTAEHCEDQTTTKLEETPQGQTVHEQGGADDELYTQNSADTTCTDSDNKLECFNSDLSLPPEITLRKYKRGRRSSLYGSVLQEQVIQVDEQQMNHDVQESESEQGDAAATMEENKGRASSDSQEEGEAVNFELAPWQADFNFEDVFKPVVTRGQRSVRRSLRNQNTSSSAGLAWQPWTSPEFSKESRRRTRGRRLSAALPVQPSAPEETLENVS